MKKGLVLLLGIFLILGLCACTEAEETYVVERGWRTFQVDTKACTVSDGTHTYTYTFNGDSESYGITVTYPDGSSYTQSKSGTHITGSASKDYDPNRYVSGDMLCDAIAESAPNVSGASNGGNLLIAVFAVGVGLFLLGKPELAWYLEWGWRFKDVEPSNLALAANRISGGILILLGILCAVLFVI